MLQKNMFESTELKLEEELENTWSVDLQEDEITIETETAPVWMRIEAEANGRLIATAYRKCDWNGQNRAPVLISHTVCHSEEAAVQWALETCRSEATQPDVSLDFNTVPVEKVIEAIENTDAVFAAVSEDFLARGLFRINYHVLPVGNISTLEDVLKEFDVVEVAGQPFLLRFNHVLHTHVHFYRRVPLYSEGTFGLDAISTEDGLEAVREFVSTDADPIPAPSQTVEVEQLIQELIRADSAGIGVEPALSNEKELTFKVWITPAEGYDVVGSYEQVVLEGETYDLNWQFNCVDGPELSLLVPIYDSESTIGPGAEEIDEGLRNLRKFVERDYPQTFRVHEERVN